jgi:serine/threonine-protein kinase
MIGGSETEFSLSTILGQNCLGTADYIAPEQSLDSLNVDPRADIYSLGCTFHFLVTGQVPFPTASVSDKLKAHRKRRAPRVCDLNPKIPERVSKIIQKMMAKHPENRFQNAAEVQEILSPMAYRKPLDFDFDTLIARRAKVAERRLASESILRGDSRTTAASRLEIGPPRGDKEPARRTAVPPETAIDPRKQSDP